MYTRPWVHHPRKQLGDSMSQTIQHVINFDFNKYVILRQLTGLTSISSFSIWYSYEE